jgi:predicted transcriptional regulator
MAEPTVRRGRPNIVGIDKGIGPLEAQIVRAIAEIGQVVTVRAVCDHLARDGYFAYQGVLNCMNRLARKGILERTERQGTFLYRPLVDLEELTAQVIENVLGHMGGEIDRVVCRMLRIDPDKGAREIARLREKLRSSRQKRKR